VPRLTPLRALTGWRRYVRTVWLAVRRVAPDAEVYLVGGAAESRLTVASDIDILVVLPHEPSFHEAVELREKILESAESLGLPPYAPIELHITGPRGLERYRRRGRLVRLDELVAGEE